ncbi:hypothetical protein PHLGIDRAFT_497415 [Phlebiopsis gigantea 11061_1 CR5-6]|uniref:Phytocyanin domain-containing protein n=1 Tax=Phlebiopsis gigantea (strain 11061_1 CR5-6) TaxID=745531 RepID=A0A0C3PDH9_PHLG1|nr:hypothetical protein PHLGIDRAFT_497415 [Phlebiopsis gigantea 11061_1 CR5-6]
MRTATVTAAVLSAASLAVAQNQTFNIQVGAEVSTPGGVFQFIPSNITAPVGSTITFTWKGSPGNHTVTQSTSSDPCNPLSNGFDSGFLFIPANTTSNFPTWNVTVTDDAPIYFYCAQLAPIPHCNAGMVGSINAPATGNGSWESVQALAMSLNSTAPGQPTAGAPLQGVNVSVTAAPGPVATSAGIKGVDLPGGSAASSAAGSSGSAGSSASASSGAPSPSATGGGTSGALANAVSGAALFVSAVFGALLL